MAQRGCPARHVLPLDRPQRHGRCAERDREHAGDACRGLVAEDEEVGRQRVEGERVHERKREVRARGSLEAHLAHAAREPRERCGLGGPGVRERPVREDVRDADRAEREGERDQKVAEVPGAAEESRADRSVHGGADEQVDAAVARIAVLEERLRGVEREAGARNDEGRRKRNEPLGLAPQLPADAGGEVQQAEDRRERKQPRVGPSSIGEEHEHLRRGQDRARDQEPAPAKRHSDGDGRCQHERHEGGADGGETRVGDQEGRRHHRADESDSRDELFAPNERHAETDGGDARRDDECCCSGKQVVQRGCCKQRRVAARDARADCGDGGVRPAVAAPQLQPGNEEEERRDAAQRDSRAGADPAAVHRQGEEEDDPEHGHGAAGDREAFRAEDGGPVDLALLARRAGGTCGARRRVGATYGWRRTGGAGRR